MTRDEIVALLRGKLVDAELVHKLWATRVAQDAVGAVKLRHSPFSSGETATWWFKREAMRLELAVYKTTAVIDTINQHYPWMAVHVSTEDDSMVAYTPDEASGQADRQLRIQLGRLLKRLWPTVADTIINNRVADHKGELAHGVELLSGEAIVEAYKSTETVSSCMVGTRSWRTHPAVAYMAPNIFMAVRRNAEGRITARAMVFHASEHDKRIIRLYGDEALRVRLHREGYRNGTWIGAKFNTVRYSDHEDHKNIYIMPYLDGNNGPGSTRHSCVMLIDGVITCVSGENYDKIKAVAPEAVVCATNTSGNISLIPFDASGFTTQDALTGETINLLETETVSTMKADGSLGLTKHKDKLPLRLMHRTTSSDAKYIYMPEGTKAFTYQRQQYIDIDACRQALGFTKLSATFYPGNGEWIAPYSGEFFSHLGDANELIKREDAVILFRRNPEDGQAHYVHMHKSCLQKKKHLPTLKLDRFACYVEDASLCVITDTGRRAIPQYHSITKLWNGKWGASRGLRHQHIHGAYYYYKADEPIPADFATSVEAESRVYDMVSYVSQSYPGDSWAQILIRVAHNLHACNYRIWLNSHDYYYTDNIPIEHAETLFKKAMTASSYSETAKLLLRIYNELMCEAQAVEAPHYLLDPEPIPAVEAQPEERAELVLEI